VAFDLQPAIIARSMSQSPPPAATLASVSARSSAPWIVFPTAFLEGASVIIIEIAGARALAPFFGTSLQVWTATITVTLFFLAVGYGLGGMLARRLRGWMLPSLFGTAGFWTALYPVWRTAILDITSQKFGVAIGSLFSASILFGVPLLMLGAVSPVLIAYIDRRRPGAGTAAGKLFFTNTMGGLIGGWVTAFVLIPHSSLRVALVCTGIGLILLGLIWVIITRSMGSAMLVVPILLLAGYIFAFVHPQHAFVDKYGIPFQLLFSRQSGIGLLQVLDYDHPRHSGRMLLINGVMQGEMDRQNGRAGMDPDGLDYIHNLHLLSYSLHPNAKTALQLGLGAGLMPKELARRGVKVTAIEIEPRMVELSRKYFDLPDSVDVRISDARTFLRNDPSKYDLIFLDTFASESTAWYLLTKEAFTEMRDKLNPGGRLIINTVSYASPDKPGLDRVETSVLAAFPQAMVYPEQSRSDNPEELINATIVAGDNLTPQMALPPNDQYAMRSLQRLLANARPARNIGQPTTDDRSDTDYVQAPLRIRWRTLIWDAVNSTLLWD
jgi:spermidine synthase